MFCNRLLRKRDNSAHKIYNGRQLFSAEMGGFGNHFPFYPAVWKVNIIYLCWVNTCNIVKTESSEKQVKLKQRQQLFN